MNEGAPQNMGEKKPQDEIPKEEDLFGDTEAALKEALKRYQEDFPPEEGK